MSTQQNNVEDLLKISIELRKTIIEMLYKIGKDYKGHPGPALSIADIIACLYFKVLKIDPKNPNWQERDRFVLSKGHACPVLYAALAMKGFFNKSELYNFRHIGSMLQGHPDMRKTPGIDMTTGSLGNGLGAGVGMALSAKMDNKKYMVYVIVGDGEMQEGIIWEAVLAAGHYELNNLIMIIDRNRWQSCDRVNCIIDTEPLSDKLSSFKWNVVEIDGHNMEEIISALTISSNGKPQAIIANTIKGKGISFMEEDNSWHQRPIIKEEYEKAISELKGRI